MTITPLTMIAALARSGAPDRAWLLFEREGYGERRDDPAALAVKGRLLKDRAMRADGAARASLLADAAAAYAAADALVPAPYLLINVATLTALGGDADRAAAIAGEVLAQLDHEVAETPYYLAATRAEALVLRDDQAGAEWALDQAMALLPDGWDERAGTLRQLSHILAARGGHDAWLDRFRAPASLHYAGHLGIAPPGADALRSRIAEVIADRHVGFAFGALAAGADLLIADAVLSAGAALHVVLPCSAEAFARQSVAPYGPAWLPRYESCLSAATSIRIVAQTERAFDPLATGLAAEAAMGATLLHARRMASTAVQLVVIDDEGGPFGGGASTERDALTWPTGPLADQIVLRWPRDAPVPPSSGNAGSRPGRALMAVIAIAPDRDLQADELDDWIEQVRMPLHAALPAPRPSHVQPHGNGVLVAFGDVAQAADFALAVRAAPLLAQAPTRLAGAYGLVHVAQDHVAGSAVATAEVVLAAAVPGTVTVDDLFADALALRSDCRMTEMLGDYDRAGQPPLSLHALI